MRIPVLIAHRPTPKQPRRFASPFTFVFLLTVASSFAVYYTPLPRINVRWDGHVTQSEQETLEATDHLRAPEYAGDRTWSYSLVDASTDNISRLVGDPAVEDTHRVDRATFELTEPPPPLLFLFFRFLVLSSLSGVAVASLTTLIVPSLWAFFITKRKRRFESLARLSDTRKLRRRLRTRFSQAIGTPLFKWMTVSMSMLLALLLGEAMNRTYDKYSDLRSVDSRELLDYDDTWRQGGLGPGGFLKENFSGYVIDGYGGRVWWQNNSQGFRNAREFTKTKDDGVLRILSMGDSFTAGYRVGQEDTVSALLEQWATETIAPTEVIVSCIEAPSIGLTYLRASGVHWEPDLVLLGVTLGNDIAQDYISRDDSIQGFQSGLEGYDLPDHTLAERQPASRTAGFLRRHSRLYTTVTDIMSTRGYAPGASYGVTPRPKMFDAIHGLGFFIKVPPKSITDALDRHLEVLRDYRDYLRPRDIGLAVLLFPQRFQVQPKDWVETVISYSLNDAAFDLMYPNRIIMNFCVEFGIVCIDPTSEMKRMHEDTDIDFYLPRGDMHWNREGHRAWFEGAKQELEDVIHDVL